MRRVCVLVVAACTVIACKSRTPRPPRVDDPENQALLGKLKGYLTCLDDHVHLVFQVADIYTSRTRDVPVTEDSNLVLHATPEPSKCISDVMAAQLRLPVLPELDIAGAAFVTALVKVHALTSEGETYLDRASPAYDRTKAIALHGQLVAAFAAFDAAEAALFDQVQQLNRKVRLDQLARREKREGGTLAVRIDDLMLQAEEVVRTAAVAHDRLDVVDVSTFRAQLAAYEDLEQRMAARALAEPKEVEAFEGYYHLYAQSKAFALQCRQLARRTTGHIPYNEIERMMIASGNEPRVPGAPGAVISAYDRLVDAYGVR